MHHLSSLWQQLLVLTHSTVPSVLPGTLRVWCIPNKPPPFCLSNTCGGVHLFPHGVLSDGIPYSCGVVHWLLDSTHWEGFGAILGCLVTTIRSHRSGRLGAGWEDTGDKDKTSGRSVLAIWTLQCVGFSEQWKSHLRWLDIDRYLNLRRFKGARMKNPFLP